MRRRRALRTALATTVAVLATATTATAARAPKSLTHQFPLGSHTLSHSATTSQGATTSTSQPSPAAPAQSAPGQTHAPAHRATGSPQHHATSHRHGPRYWLLITLIVVVLVVVFADVAVSRRSRGTSPRRRRSIAKPLLVLLSPAFGYDYNRDAWVLRGIGQRYGPVLRPTGYVPIREIAPTAAPEVRARRATEADRAPDPFAPGGPPRLRSRKDDRVPPAPPDREPRPLVIRPRDE